MNSLLQSTLEYFRSRSVVRVLFDLTALIAFSTWAGFVYLGVTNFSTAHQIWKSLSEPEIVDVRSASLLNTKIDLELDTARHHINADRVSLNKFHNGKKDLNGAHFVFSSRTNASVSNGIAASIIPNQNVPLSFFAAPVSKLVENECYVNADITAETSATYVWWHDLGVSSIIECPVLNSSQEVIAYIGAEWVTSHLAGDASPTSFTVNSLRETATRIGVLLSLQQ